MQVPKRKPGKFTGLKADPNITPAKYAELKASLGRLLRARPAAIAEVKRLAADGDFSENHAYSLAKGRLRGINRRIDEIEDHLKRAIIIELKAKYTQVELGATVTVETGGKEKSYTILGSTETDPVKNIISNNSPLGRALMGKRAGDLAILKINGRENVYRILNIE